jgi:hypothetical protein
MSVMGHKRTLKGLHPMSAFPPKWTLLSDSCMSSKCQKQTDAVKHGCNDLLNHLVGGNEQVGRYIKAKCLGSLEIDSRLEPRRSLNW